MTDDQKEIKRLREAFRDLYKDIQIASSTTSIYERKKTLEKMGTKIIETLI